MHKLFTLLLTVWVCVLFASPSDTITYKQRRGTRIEKGLLDISSGAQRVINSDHAHIHNYEAYSKSLVDTLDNQQTLMIAIHIPDTVEFHLKAVTVWGEGSPFTAEIYNDPDTIRLSTDTLVPQNRNQADNRSNSLFPSLCTVTDSVDTVGLTNVLDPIYFGGGDGTGQSTFAGGGQSHIEWVFENDYLVVVLRNLSGATKLATLGIFWYELKE